MYCSRKSNHSENEKARRNKYCNRVVPFQDYALSDITNVVEHGTLTAHPRQNEKPTQVWPESQMRCNAIDLTDNGLFDNTISYGNDVPIEISTSSSNLVNVPEMLIDPIDDGNDIFIGKKRARRPYKRRINDSDQSNSIVVDTNKPKRKYVRKNNSLAISNGMFVGNGGSTESESLANVVNVKEDVARKNISRRLSRKTSAYKSNVRVIDSDIDHDVNKGSGPPIFRMHGQNYHLIGSLLPENGASPMFAQMYIFDTENEVSNTKNSVSEEIIDGLKIMLDENNKLVKTFRMAKDRILENGDANVRARLIGKRTNNRVDQVNGMPTCSEVAVLVVGDFDSALCPRDILVELKSGFLRRINELNVSYLALQYPLLLPYGDDEYTEDIPFTNREHKVEKSRKSVSVREYFSFRLHDRKDEASTILVFKVNELIRELRQNQVFGKVVAVVCTIEFKKRGLPHAHILLFLAKENKYPTPDDIDRIISDEIPDKEYDPSCRENDDEEELCWAAIERLPTRDRLSKGLLRSVLEDGTVRASVVNLKRLGADEKKQLVDRILNAVEEDNEKFLQTLRSRADRVGIEIPKIEIRYEHLAVEGDVHVGSRALPTLINATFNSIEQSMTI
ncbi:hypothetical protein CASFOL_001463 [Castilleja foliolosa]|uniref:Helitron helicase-like domain-containing protein n=1 Tax=Castilleja foliolosa TaxID=1961234 RepID=A0ABD3EJY0_9LAMI